MNGRLLVRRGFNFSIGTLIRDAQRLLRALKDTTVGSELTVYLSPAFVADFETQIARVTQLSTDQKGAVGAVLALTSKRADAETDFIRVAAAARRAARFVFAGDGAFLRSQFLVGLAGSQTMAARLDRGRKLLASCRLYPTALATAGFSAANADQFERALDTLQGIDRTGGLAKGGKEGLTAQNLVAANLLYQQCVTIQHAARVVYAGSTAPGNATAVEARVRFLLDEFPPRARTAAKVVAPAPPGAVTADLGSAGADTSTQVAVALSAAA